MNTAVTSPQEPVTDDGFFQRLGLILVVLIFFGFGTWAITAPISGAVVSQGVITIKGNRKAVQHPEGGIVKHLLVNEGQTVEKGEPLIQLDETLPLTDLNTLKGELQLAKAKEARLLAEDSASEINQLSDGNHFGQNELKRFDARQAERLGEISMLEQRIEQLQAKITGLEELITAKQRRIQSYEEDIQSHQKLVKQSYVDKTTLRELQRLQDELVGEAAEHRAEIASTAVQISETRLNILQINKSFTTTVVDELAQVQAQIYDLTTRMTALTDRLERTVIRAPAAGYVMALAVHTEGGVIQAGQALMEIVPLNSEIEVTANVTPQDIDRLSLGLDVRVRLPVLDSVHTPVLHGVLEKISADRLHNTETGQAYYETRINIPADELGTLQQYTLKPGMPADVLIQTEARTFFQYLMKPLQNATAKAFTER